MLPAGKSGATSCVQNPSAQFPPEGLPVTRNILTGALLAAAAALTGCGGSIDTEGHVRLVNATTNASALDLYESSDRILAGVAPGSASGYVDLEEDSYTLLVKNAGSGSTAATLSAAIDKETSYTVVAYLSGGEMNAEFIKEKEDDPSDGTAKLRIFNAAPVEVESVDVYLLDDACSTLGSSDIAMATGVTGLQDSFSEITAASAGTTYHVCVTAAGDRADLRLEIPALSLKDQQIATLILTRTTGGVLLDGLLLNQKGSATAHANGAVRLRLAADAASGGVVTAAANGTTLGASFASPTVGAYKLVAAGDLDIKLSIAGTAVSAGDLSASAGTDLTLLVTGTAAAPGVTLLVDDNLPSTSSTKPVKLRLVNGLNGIGSGALMLTVDGDVVADSVSFGSASNTVNVTAAAATAEFDVSFAGSSLWSASDQTLSSGKVYTVFLLGDAGGTVKGILRADR